MHRLHKVLAHEIKVDQLVIQMYVVSLQRKAVWKRGYFWGQREEWTSGRDKQGFLGSKAKINLSQVVDTQVLVSPLFDMFYKYFINTVLCLLNI